MKNYFIAFVLVFTCLASSAQELKVVSDGVTIRFKVYSEDVEGSIGGFEATIKFDATNLSESSISGSVKTETIDTGNKTRDEHIRSSDYLHASKYPKITFSSRSIEESEDKYVMKGLLNLMGVEKEITIKFSYENKVFVAKSYFYLADFGLDAWKKRDDSKIKVYWKIKVEE